MIKIDGIEYRTKLQWLKEKRVILEEEEDNGVYREWDVWRNKTAWAEFYSEDQTRLATKEELAAAKEERRKELSCSCCGKYWGRQSYEGENQFDSWGRCEFCSENHTAWQWLQYKHRVPKKGEQPRASRPSYFDGEDWAYGRKYYYYRSGQTEPVDDAEYERLKALYIKKYGGWDTIDLEHTTYDGHIWW